MFDLFLSRNFSSETNNFSLNGSCRAKSMLFFAFAQAVKLESSRLGRTRYLVVVSCSRKPAQRKSIQSQQQQHFNNTINAQNININNNKGISSIMIRSGSNDNQNSNSSTMTPSPHRKLLDQQAPNSPAIIATTLKTGAKHLINEKDRNNLGRLSQDEKQPNDQFDELDQPNMNEVEESCLLGIDCNEKTSVGLVLRIMGDTTIRLDGDG